MITGDRIKDAQPGFEDPSRSGGSVVAARIDDTRVGASCARSRART